MNIIKIGNSEISHVKNEIIDKLKIHWGNSNYIVSKGKKHNLNEMDYFALTENNEIKGAAGYKIKKGKCEILCLNSFDENRGIGTELLNLLIKEAKDKNCSLIFLVTTNDNRKALKFYQKKNFMIKKIKYGIIDKYRKKLKPSIPEKGFDDIPISDEIEMDMKL